MQAHKTETETGDALAELAGGASDTWAQELSEALAVLRAHIAKEQDGLFPASLTSLTTADWESAEQVRRRVGSTAW